VDAHAVVDEPPQELGRRMAVGVVRAHRHQGDPRVRRGEEISISVGTAVVGHLQHVGGQIDAVPDQAILCFPAEVTGQEHPQTADRDPQDEGQVVRFGSGHCPFCPGRQHLELGRAEAQAVAGSEQRPGAGRASEHRVEGSRPVVVRRQRTGRDDPDVPAGQRAGQSAHVVGVQVAEEHQRELVDAQAVQAAVDRTHLGAGVHQHTRARRDGDDERVPLPDVAGDEDRVVGRPAPGDLAERPAGHDEGHQRDHPEDADAPGAPQQRDRQHEQDAQRQGADGPGRPRDRSVGQAGRALGHEHQPAHRPPGQPDQDIARRRVHRGEHRGAETEHGGQRHGRCREQVGRDRHQADRAVETGDEGRRRQTRRSAHRQRIGDRRGPAPLPQPPRPPRSEQDDRRRRGDRQREARVLGQVGLQQEQHDRRRGESRHGGAGSAGGQRPERDPAHGGGAHDARRRPREDDEGDQPHERHPDLHAAIDGAPAQRPQHRGQDDCDVGTGHRSQMGQPRAPEVLLQDRVGPTRVADDQSGEEAGGTRGQHPGSRSGQLGAHRSGGRLPPGWWSHGGRRAASRHHGDDRVPGSGGGHGDPGPHALTREQLAPALDGREQQHRRPDRANLVRRDEPNDSRVGEATRYRTAAEDPQIAVQGEDGFDRAAHHVRRPQR
jgi:hypothetical protein